MEHQIKTLIEAITHEPLKRLVTSHVKELMLENNHLVIFVDNAAPLHELNLKSMDEHMKKALEKIYDHSITYEYRTAHIHNKPDHHQDRTAKKSH